MELKRLNDKVIVISGGTKGVGRAFAEIAGREGAKVVIGGRDENAGKEAVRSIKAVGADGVFVHCDLLKVDDCKNLFDVGYEQFGKIDGFFNYAGVTPVSPLDTCDEETFDWVTNINYKAAFFCCQQAIKYMRMNDGGSIVLAGSAHAWGGQKDRAESSLARSTRVT